MAQIVEDGQSAGEINPEIEPHSVANLVISILEGAGAVARINKRSAALDDAQRHLSLYLETVVRLSTDSLDGKMRQKISNMSRPIQARSPRGSANPAPGEGGR